MTGTNLPPRELIEFVALFNREQFYDAHEVLEDLWVIEVPPLKDYYKGLIMASVALCHWQRGNPVSARRMLDLAMPRLLGTPASQGGIELPAFLEMLAALRCLLGSSSPPEWRTVRLTAFHPIRMSPKGE